MKKFKIPAQLTKPEPIKPKEQQDLEIISVFLRPSTAAVDSILEAINSHSIVAQCEWGYQPILRYTPEALTTYATRLYKHIQQDLGSIAVTEVDYVAQWLAQEATIKAWFDSKEAGFIRTLESIVANPMQLPTYIIDDTGLHTQISTFLAGKHELFSNLPSFLYYSYSPLRAHTKDVSDDLIDPRIAALLAEVDKMRVKCNKALNRFIDAEIKRCNGLCKERLNYYKLKQDDITLITTRKDLLQQADWFDISQALDSKVVPEKVKKLIKDSIKSIKKAPPADATQDKSAELAFAVDVNEAFIGRFIPQVAEEYTKVKIKIVADAAVAAAEGYEGTGIDGILGLIAATYLARETGTSFETLQSQQAASEDWYFDFANIQQPLIACLQIALNSISPSVLLAPEVLSHRAIQGMLAFANYVKTKQGTYINYEQAAEELHHQLKHHTSAFLDLPPLPDIQPVSKEVLLGAIAGTIQQAKVTNRSFNLTKPIQPKLDALRPTVAFTKYKEVSLTDVEIQSLVPVPDATITQLLVLVAGKGCKPYLLKGNLIACTVAGQYIKIVPDIDGDGYANYNFTAVNGKTLNFIIDKYCELLRDVPAFNDLIGYYYMDENTGEAFFGIEKVYDYTLTEDDLEAIQAFADVDIDELSTIYADMPEDYFADSSLSTINALLKARMQSTREHFGLTVLSDKLDSQARLYAEDCKLLKYLKMVVDRVYEGLDRQYHVPFTKYFEPSLRISGHYLSKWVADPKEYTDKITNGGGAYSIDHGDKNRSNNDPDNLSIELVDYNAGRTSRSIEVMYNGKPYVSMSIYCTETDAGKYKKLLELRDELQLGATAEYNRRIYTLDEERKFTVTDAEHTVPKVTYNDKEYATLPDFVKEKKLSPDAVRQARSRAKKAGISEFKCKSKTKTYTFYLEENGSIKII